MNNALAELYGSDNLIRLADKDSGFNHSIWDRVVKWLHSKRGYDIDDKPVKDLINETYRVLSEGVNSAITEEVPAELTQSLLNNTYIFSGFKTYHEMRQASALLRSSTGGFKSFEQFYRDVKKIDNTYNRSYLAAEYEFAVQSTQMAVKWKDWEEMGDRYMLQYRTAGDERVREEHAALNNTTLPMSDKFWDSYLPPLGWRCRCTVVQVRKDKYRISDSDAACKAGEHATSLPKQKIFRFNPGKTGKVFPPKHPYLPKGCGSCEVKLSFDPKREVCKVCLFLDKEKRYQYNKDLYDKLSKDPNYKDVEFDEVTGGLKASHIGHNFDKVGGEYEKQAQRAGVKQGYSVIFEDEYSNILGQRFTEGKWNSLKFEIAGCETGSSNNILRGLKHCASKRETEVAVIVLPNTPFNKDIFDNSIGRYKGLEKLNDGQYVRFKRIICINNEEIVYETDL